MPTNKIALRSAEQFMADYVPTYDPFYSLLLGKSQGYSQEVGELNFRRVEAVGDIRAKHITPKDTEIRQISVQEGKKTFKKYFLANQYIQSKFQDSEGVEQVQAQVLDEHQKQMDSLVLEGDGGVNNGLYTSSDPNYVTESSTEVAKDADSNYLNGLHTKVMVTVAKADLVSGRKALIFFGSNFTPLFDGVYPNAIVPFKKVLGDVLGAGYQLAKLPTAVTPSGAQGWMIVNLDQIKFHYTALPQLMNAGQNEEKLYVWSNFLMGSSMVDVLALNGIIRQPATLQA